MKPFNLQEALAGKPVVDRKESPVKNLHYFGEARAEQKLYGMDLNGDVNSYGDDGRFFEGDSEGSQYDLFMASEKKEGWMNLYRRGTGEVYPGATIFDSLEKAKNAANGAGSVTTIKISWEE